MTPEQAKLEVIKRCQKSVAWFLRNFGKIKHPSAGVIPFDPFKYQLHALTCFRKNRLNIFRKCRQAGVSKISGAFALWFAMFNAHKTILIVSRRNEDAMSFLREHIYFLFNNLPPWMREIWTPTKQNEHEVFFPNGSKIQSLTSHPEVLRSHAASLNIIDEAAFIPNMDVLWAAGWPTLQHGGSVICISTSNGVGNWYWSAWTDAEAGVSPFNPIIINWWDMDWSIEYTDPLSLDKKRIAPRDNLRQCSGKAEISKYGPYWSPWLEEQWQALQEQGEGWKFEQEVLAAFIGSGNTVLDKNALAAVALTIKPPVEKVNGLQTFTHPTNNVVSELDFSFIDPDQGFWIWHKPINRSPERRRGKIILEESKPAHRYVMGVDIATGKGRDYSTIEVFDLDTREQAAEFMARVLPRELAKYIDRIGRYYNNALAVIERNNGGDIIIDALRHDFMYPRLWRRKDINDKPQAGGKKRRPRALKVAPYGYATTASSKPTMNKFLIDYIREDDSGYRVYSQRLLKQFQTYVRKRDKSGRDTSKTEAEDGAGNFDDLVIATALAFIGTSDAFIDDGGIVSPANHNTDFRSMVGPTILTDEQRVVDQQSFIEKGGSSLLIPMSMEPIDLPEIAAQRVLDQFTYQLGAIPSVGGRPLVTPPKFYRQKRK